MPLRSDQSAEPWRVARPVRRGGEAGIPPRDTLDLAGLLEATVDIVTARFGAATTKRVSGEDLWTLYEGSGWSLRIRAMSPPEGDSARVRSWTLALEDGYETLTEACEALGLGSPGESSEVRSPEDPEHSMLRCSLPSDDSDDVYSLTATRRFGQIRSLTAFDEAPDWSSEAHD